MYSYIQKVLGEPFTIKALNIHIVTAVQRKLWIIIEDIMSQSCL